MKNLHELIGEEILAKVPLIHRGQYQTLRLHGVEEGGIWIESEVLTQLALSMSKKAAAGTPIFFLPFHQIQFLMQMTEKLALSEKAFGV